MQVEERKYYPVLDHGFVSLWDHMGGDADIEQAARLSYQKGTRQTSDTRKLLRHLYRERHCYAGSMQVLTVEGWKAWQDLQDIETFLIPDPQRRVLFRETLSVKTFDCDEEMVTYSNSRMSFVVTGDHRMWFKPKYQDEFSKIRASEMPKWGHFDPLQGYSAVFSDERCAFMEFVGFYLGDGSSASTHKVTFHLSKSRKQVYLLSLLASLSLPYTVRTTSKGKVYTVDISGLSYFQELHGIRSKDKYFPEDVGNLKDSEISGLFTGLVMSDGSVSKDRPQISFSSNSKALAVLFETLSAYLGIDAHFNKKQGETYNVTAYTGNRTTLEARKQYFGSAPCESGKVYCATSSTGLLMVRGSSTEFGFVCGNTSPFEMVEFKFHCAMPIFVARQWVRHRTASLNEMSGRYSEIPQQYYQPEVWRVQSLTNKQGSGEDVPEYHNKDLNLTQRGMNDAVFGEYNRRLGIGVARELARIDLPLSTYTQWVWKIDLHNLLHFLTLRTDGHAQSEIQAFSNVIAALIRPIVPIAFEAWLDYRVNSAELSYQMVDALMNPGRPRSELGMSKRELDYFQRIIDGKHPYVDPDSLTLPDPLSKEQVQALFCEKD